MAVDAAPQPTNPPRYAAAYVIDNTSADAVRKLLRMAGLIVHRDTAVGPTQMPRFTVSSPLPPGEPLDVQQLVLTERERQVLVGMSEGKGNEAIGQDLFLTVNTVKTHARSLFRKLRVVDRAQAVHVGHQRGILGGDA